MESSTNLAAPPTESPPVEPQPAVDEERYPIPGTSITYVFRDGVWSWEFRGRSRTELTPMERPHAEALRDAVRAAALANRMRVHAEWEARVLRAALRRVSPLHARTPVRQLAERYEIAAPDEVRR
jgi:hypothetical protein